MEFCSSAFARIAATAESLCMTMTLPDLNTRTCTKTFLSWHTLYCPENQSCCGLVAQVRKLSKFCGRVNPQSNPTNKTCRYVIHTYNCAAGYLLILLWLPPSLYLLFLAAVTSKLGVTDSDDGKVIPEPRVSARAAVSND
jgi:hypothetical protein